MKAVIKTLNTVGVAILFWPLLLTIWWWAECEVRFMCRIDEWMVCEVDYWGRPDRPLGHVASDYGYCEHCGKEMDKSRV